MTKRIIPISSGKGGVGKTSFAVNLSLSLSKYGRTILIDLDTGTSSLRNTIRTPVKRDLYHFFKHGCRLDQCITELPPKIDRGGQFGNFGFIASPKHFIEAISNMNQTYRNRLIDGINELKADFIILDQNLFDLEKAGRVDLISETRVLKTIFEGKVSYNALQNSN